MCLSYLLVRKGEKKEIEIEIEREREGDIRERKVISVW